MKEVLRSLEGVDLFPIISIIIFMVFFVGLLIYVIRLDKRQVKYMAALPTDVVTDDSLMTFPPSPSDN